MQENKSRSITSSNKTHSPSHKTIENKEERYSRVPRLSDTRYSAK